MTGLVLVVLCLPMHSAEKPSLRVNRTLANIRTLAAAVESYASDHKRYPAASSYAELKALVSPKYVMIEEEIVDGWGNEFAYSVTEDGCHYRIVSPGSDRSFEPASRKMSADRPARRVGRSEAEDTLFQDNAFLWVPLNAEDAFDLHEDSTFSCP